MKTYTIIYLKCPNGRPQLSEGSFVKYLKATSVSNAVALFINLPEGERTWVCGVIRGRHKVEVTNGEEV